MHSEYYYCKRTCINRGNISTKLHSIAIVFTRYRHCAASTLCIYVILYDYFMLQKYPFVPRSNLGMRFSCRRRSFSCLHEKIHGYINLLVSHHHSPPILHQIRAHRKMTTALTQDFLYKANDNDPA